MKWIIPLLCILFAFPAHAKKKKDFKFGGRIGLGMNDDNDPADENAMAEPNFEVRFHAKSPRVDGFKGVFEVKATENAREVSINDVYVDYRNEEKTHRVRFGRGKKTLGWEYEYPTSTRLTVSRSNLYQFMGERALVGRDYFASIAWVNTREPEEEESRDLDALTDSNWFDPEKLIDPNETWKYELALHMNEMKDTALIASALYTASPEWRFGAWLMGERAQAGVKIFGVWEAVLSMLYQNSQHRAAVELMSGVDPYRTEIERAYGTSNTYTFAAAKAEYGFYLARWNPYLLGSLLFKDVTVRSDRTAEGTFGLRYFFAENLSLVGEGTLLTSIARSDPTTGSLHESQVKVLARYFF